MPVALTALILAACVAVGTLHPPATCSSAVAVEEIVATIGGGQSSLALLKESDEPPGPQRGSRLCPFTLAFAPAASGTFLRHVSHSSRLRSPTARGRRSATDARGPPAAALS